MHYIYIILYSYLHMRMRDPWVRDFFDKERGQNSETVVLVIVCLFFKLFSQLSISNTLKV